LLATTHVWAVQRYSASGLVLKVDRAHQSVVVSCREIPGYMEAMVMSFHAREPKELANLEPGSMVEFMLVVDQVSSYVENVRVRRYESPEKEPMTASRLKLLENLTAPDSPAAPLLAIGEPVPDFSLTDQDKRVVHLTQFAGKVVVINFIYTRCPLPDYCFRLSNNFGRLQKRFANRMGRELVLLTISFDPIHDQPEILAGYAQTWKANPRAWRFLTGTVPQVRHVCGLFGVNFWPDEATLTHSLHTVIIDRQGKLAANLEGNLFTAEQLGDLVTATITVPH